MQNQISPGLAKLKPPLWVPIKEQWLVLLKEYWHELVAPGSRHRWDVEYPIYKRTLNKEGELLQICIPGNHQIFLTEHSRTHDLRDNSRVSIWSEDKRSRARDISSTHLKLVPTLWKSIQMPQYVPLATNQATSELQLTVHLFEKQSEDSTTNLGSKEGKVSKTAVP